MTRQAGARTASIAALLLGACCTTPPAERYFDRLDAFNTVNAFAYAVDTGQWAFAYDCLTPESKKLFTFTKFKLALRFNIKVPVDPENPKAEVPIRDLITGAERNRYRIQRNGRREAEALVRYQVPKGPLLEEGIVLRRESEEEAKSHGREDPLWLIDLDRTVRGMQGLDRGGDLEVEFREREGQPPPPQPPAAAPAPPDR